MAKRDKSLKAKNVTWLVSFVFMDCALILVFLYANELDQRGLSSVGITRAAAAAIAPPLVLLLCSLLPAGVKAAIVFWRVRDILPGHRAFSYYAERDTRLTLSSLRKAVGKFPTAPREQNAKWYSLYKKVESQPAVLNAHGNYLLFRDLAALSLLLAAGSFPLFLVIGEGASNALLLAILFLVQYAVTAVAARNHGVTLVNNVLAAHASKD